MKKLFFFILFPVLASAQYNPVTNDSDLSRPRPGNSIKKKIIGIELRADDMKLFPRSGSEMRVEVYRQEHQRVLLMGGLKFQITSQNGICDGIAELQNPFFSVNDGKVS